MPKAVLLALGLVLGSTHAFAATGGEIFSKLNVQPLGSRAFAGTMSDGHSCNVVLRSTGEKVLTTIAVDGEADDHLIGSHADAEPLSQLVSREAKIGAFTLHSLDNPSESATLVVQNGTLKSVTVKTKGMLYGSNVVNCQGLHSLSDSHASPVRIMGHSIQ